jgi:hypothetical protein
LSERQRLDKAFQDKIDTLNRENEVELELIKEIEKQKEAKLKAIELFGINIMTAINIVEAEQKLVIQE